MRLLRLLRRGSGMAWACVLVLASPCPLLARGLDFDPRTATESYVSRLSPEELARSAEYVEQGYWLFLARSATLILLGAVVFFSGWGARLAHGLERRIRRPSLQVWVFASLWVSFLFLCVLPFALWDSFVRESRQLGAVPSLEGWMLGQVLFLSLLLLLLPPSVVLLYALLRRHPRTWWLWGAGVASLSILFLMVILPVLIQPLFTPSIPLEDGPVKKGIEGMVRENGLSPERIYTVLTSPEDKRIRARVSGLLGTRRITLNDNLLERCSLAEIRAVMGHELGHHVLGHAYWRMVFFLILSILGFAFLRGASTAIVERWGGRSRVRGVEDTASLPLLAALFFLFLLLITPLYNGFVRSLEEESDRFGLELAREPDGFAEVVLKLSEYRKLDPSPVEEWLFLDRPSGRRRILHAMEWKARHGPRETRLFGGGADGPH